MPDNSGTCTCSLQVYNIEHTVEVDDPDAINYTLYYEKILK